MDDGNTELSDKLSDNVVLFSNPESSNNLQASTASVNTVTESPKSEAARTHCTHTHSCHPPGPDAAHTHTCHHAHTRVFASEYDGDRENGEHTNSKLKRPPGNREAVRKYREKKKARTAYLEEEVQRLRLANRELVRKLQGRAVLDAELSRLKSTLARLKEKIDGELGDFFPFQKHCNYPITSVFEEGTIGSLPAGLQCQNDLPCFHPREGSSSQVDVCAYEKSMIP